MNLSLVLKQAAAILFLAGISSSLLSAQGNHAPSVNVTATAGTGDECVVLLHGLARTSASMSDMTDRLVRAGYSVANVDYPSREFVIEELARFAVPQGLGACRTLEARTIHVVTHSMGGILIRQYLENRTVPELGRIVMLAPPNHGSEVVDAMRDVPGYQWLNGPAGQQMGTEASSVPNRLGPATTDVAVIAGTLSINLVLSNYLPNPDDGKVSVASARLEGMCAMLTVSVSHPYIMEDKQTMNEVVRYLGSGKFKSERAEYEGSGLRHCPPTQSDDSA